MKGDWRIQLTAVAVLFAASCGKYADFTLPPLPQARSVALHPVLLPKPVLTRSGEHDILNPSVLRAGRSYADLYSEFDGRTWNTALAISNDGKNWVKQGRVLSPDSKTWEGDYIAANGSAFLQHGQWWYWYQAGERSIPEIGLARSPDGRAWHKETHPVLTTGPRGSWDERGVADPYVFKAGDRFYLYYLGQNRARQQQIGVARSVDGVHWTKLRSNPVMRIPWPGTARDDVNGLGEPAVWESEGWYWMLYTGRNATEHRSLLLARSSDGVHWTSQQTLSGDQPWDRAVICDATVLKEANRIRFWFGGGDQPRPDEELNGQIGEGELFPVSERSE